MNIWYWRCINNSTKMKGFDDFSFTYLINFSYIKRKMFDLLSKIWFLLSTFVFPWYFCIIWLFYSINFNDINYINTFNPWIIPFIIIYCLYSIMVIISYSFYCDFKRDKYALLMIKSSILFAGCYGMFIFYILIKHRKELDEWKIDGFYGGKFKHCFDFDIHINPTLFLVLFMIYCLITHHIFVILRAITAKLCYNHYISKEKQFESCWNSRKSLKKRSKARRSSYERRCVIDPRGGIRAPAYCQDDDNNRKYTSDDSDDSDDDGMDDGIDGIDEFDIDDFEENDESESEQGYRSRINLTPEAPHKYKSSVPPEFNLVSSVDPSVLKMSSIDAPSPSLEYV